MRQGKLECNVTCYCVYYLFVSFDETGSSLNMITLHVARVARRNYTSEERKEAPGSLPFLFPLVKVYVT